MGALSLWVLIVGVQHIIYVSPDGRDTNPGTSRLPLRSITAVRDRVRAVNRDMTGDIVVHLRPGSYPLSEPVTFSAQDGGSNGHDVIYMSDQGQPASLSGGRVI